jgi:hypothetical protein
MLSRHVILYFIKNDDFKTITIVLILKQERIMEGTQLDEMENISLKNSFMMNIV